MKASSFIEIAAAIAWPLVVATAAWAGPSMSTAGL